MGARRSTISGRKVAWRGTSSGKARLLPGMRPSEKKAGKILMSRLAMARMPEGVLKEAKKQLDSGKKKIEIQASGIYEEARFIDAGFKRAGNGLMIYTVD